MKIDRHQLRAAFDLSPKATFSFLASFYLLAFVITPYWLTPVSKKVQLISLLFSVCLGMIWSYLSASRLDFQLRFKLSWVEVGLLAGIVALNLFPLTSSIPWRGDEELHIRTAQIAPLKILVGYLACAIPFFFLAFKKPTKVAGIGFLLACVGLAILLYGSPLQHDRAQFILRYPFINYWFISFIPGLANFFLGNSNYEFLYRITPIVSIIWIAWYFSQSLEDPNVFINALFGFSVATIPLLFYYSSVLYLELPAVFLMLVVCNRINFLLTSDYQTIKSDPAWYALILLGFIKETVIVFLLIFLGLRIIAVFLLKIRTGSQATYLERKFSGWSNWLRDEMQIAFSVLFPITFYLVWRALFMDRRDFSIYLPNLLNLDLYMVTTQAWLEQFGVYFFLFCGGVLLLFLRKKYVAALFYSLVLLAFSLFYLSDKLAINYAGYSRFNLFLAPPILAGAIVSIKSLIGKNPKLGVLLAGILIVANLSMSPVNLDGTKKPMWGDYQENTSEHYYPYRETISWLRATYPNEAILFSGLYFPYFFRFYFEKYNWTPDYETLYSDETMEDAKSFDLALKEAKDKNIKIIVFQAQNKNHDTLPAKAGDFYLERLFENQAHLIAVYRAP